MTINHELFTEKQVYTLYSIFKGMERELEYKQKIKPEEEIKLISVKRNIGEIEAYALAKRQEGIRWSLTSLFQDSGMNPTLILEFYPGTESYNRYGKNLVVNVEYSESDLTNIFESIRNKASRVTGQLRFKSIPTLVDGELNTGDIFAIQ